MSCSRGSHNMTHGDSWWLVVAAPQEPPPRTCDMSMVDMLDQVCGTPAQTRASVTTWLAAKLYLMPMQAKYPARPPGCQRHFVTTGSCNHVLKAKHKQQGIRMDPGNCLVSAYPTRNGSGLIRACITTVSTHHAKKLSAGLVATLTVLRPGPDSFIHSFMLHH
jgi:hypothetical protein